ncbi:AraC family transcriptional regulator [Vagococcus sp.]|uniref:AraC family transcriptional regulator n=1 Tax=Vagococcus sp. TaxID=1933889 RepID=UPI002FC7E808
MNTEIIQLMIDWIEEHLVENFSIQDLGKAMGYSPYYCSFKFHQQTGITLKKYIQRRLLFLASQELIQQPNLPIITIAINYGYSSQEAFSRSFKSMYGITPYNYRQSKKLIQNYHTLKLKKEIGDYMIDGSKKIELAAKQENRQATYDTAILNILNGEFMYHDFKSNQLMGNSDYVPFNEAMCSNESTYPIFSSKFIKTRATGHKSTPENYIKKVWAPLKILQDKEYECLVLWFGDDMFCQINLLTILAYLEQIQYKGDIYYHAIHEKNYSINEYKLTLGVYTALYKDVILNKRYQNNAPLPVLHQGIKHYLDLSNPANPIRQFIQMNDALTDNELLIKLMLLFPDYGLGDSQYNQLINDHRRLHS